MRGYRATFRRHRVLYLLPALLAAVVVGGLSHKAPTYSATASLWVDNQASSASSLNVTPVGSQAGTPSGAEQSVLNELLATTKFRAAVATGAGLGYSSLGLVGGVTSSTPGPQVLQVNAVAPSSAIAYKIVKSVLTQLQTFSQQWAHDFATSAVAYYQAQVQSATAAVKQARAAAGAGPSASVSTATSALTAATSALNGAQAQASGHGGFSTNMVLGSPAADPAPLTGYKSMLMKAVGAAVAVLLLSALVIVVRTPGGNDEWDDAISDASSSADAGDPVPAAAGAGHAATGSAPVVSPTPAAVFAPTVTPAPVVAAESVVAAEPVVAAESVVAAEPVVAPEPVVSSSSASAADTSVTHGLRRRGLLARKTVLHQSSGHESKATPAAEGGRA